MNRRSAYSRLFFTIWFIGSVAAAFMVVNVLRIPLNPVQRISMDGSTRPKMPDCSSHVLFGELAAGNRPAAAPIPGTGNAHGGGSPDAARRPAPPGAADGCLEKREQAMKAVVEWEKDSVYAYRTGIFWYRVLFLFCVLAAWSVALWGLFRVGAWMAGKIGSRRDPFRTSPNPDGRGFGRIDPSAAVRQAFDPEFGPAPIPGIGPPLNLVCLSWVEMKRISDAFRELEIPGPGMCLSCRNKGRNDMHPIEDMYTLMDGARADESAGLKPRSSPFLIGTCRACAPEVYETHIRARQVEGMSVRNAALAACAISLWALLLLVFVRA